MKCSVLCFLVFCSLPFSSLGMCGLKALIMNKLTGLIPNRPLPIDTWTGLRNLKLADPNFDKPGNVDLLLGADVFTELLCEGKITAFNTHLGWVLSGRVHHSNGNTVRVHHSTVDLQDQLKRFWELEEVEIKPHLTLEEKACEKHFVDNHHRDANGRFCVALPKKETEKPLGSSREVAVRRLLSVERRLRLSSQYENEYNKFMQDYVDLGHMELVPATDYNKSGAVYLPHHFVTKETSTTTKLRVVFDASSKTSTGVSLNDSLMVGPKLQDDLLDIIMRFRLHKYALTADIEKMYRQIQISQDDADLQRILWRPTALEGIKEYRLTTVAYGTASAPFLAIRSLQQLAYDEGGQFPMAKEAALRDFYVDDLISGANSLEEGLELQTQLNIMLNRGGFQLRKWSSNHPALLAAVDEKDRETQLPLVIEDGSSVKTLGLHWHPAGDYFSFVVPPPFARSLFTKRILLSEISQLFDPLGWLAPSIILAKILIQRLWLLGLAWDETVPSAVSEDWITFRDQLQLLQCIRIGRCVAGSDNTSKYQLHGFCDASEQAYGAVVYLRAVSGLGDVHISLLTSKTRVAPVKQVSLPRLELCGAVLLARLMEDVKQTINIPVESVHAWTDSTIVLCWLSGLPNRWKTFVANRVSEIQGLISPLSWKHVASSDNPADAASRGVLPSSMSNHPTWWTGPSWLSSCMEDWPKSTWTENREALKEFKPVKMALAATVQADIELLTRVSTLSQLKRVTAYCFRFIQNAKVPRDQRRNGVLGVKELHSALMFWIKTIQSKEFAETIQTIKDGKTLSSANRLLTLNPFLDETGILRVGGRLSNSRLRYEEKYPILLSKSHVLTDLIISHEHIKNLHAGPQLVLACLQGHFWILDGRNAVRRLIHKCIICFRQRAVASQQFMGDLPASRVEPVRPFLRCGVDYGGPLSIKTSKGRGGKYNKAYICLFVCLAVKAVHLELVSDLTTEAFLGALKRFTARRGKSTDIYSDNGTNFVGANRELKELFKLTRSQAHNETLSNFLANEGINWHFIPPGAPHFGGLWEVGMKSVKYHLRRIVGNNALTFEELYTVLSQIEACLNSRPITFMSSDPSDLCALTPGHFLIGDSLTSVPEPDLTHLKENRLSRWQLVQKLSQQFWKRWQNEYLSRLQQRPKWTCKKPQINIGDLVLLKEENLPRLKWSLARVIEVHPGKDGLIRVVTVKTSTGTFKRPIVKVCKLPLDN